MFEGTDREGGHHAEDSMFVSVEVRDDVGNGCVFTADQRDDGQRQCWRQGHGELVDDGGASTVECFVCVCVRVCAGRWSFLARGERWWGW